MAIPLGAIRNGSPTRIWRLYRKGYPGQGSTQSEHRPSPSCPDAILRCKLTPDCDPSPSQFLGARSYPDRCLVAPGPKTISGATAGKVYLGMRSLSLCLSLSLCVFPFLFLHHMLHSSYLTALAQMLSSGTLCSCKRTTNVCDTGCNVQEAQGHCCRAKAIAAARVPLMCAIQAAMCKKLKGIAVERKPLQLQGYR